MKKNKRTVSYKEKSPNEEEYCVLNKKAQQYKQAGITLVALVVTIIVLLILAAITINMVLGQNGIIQRAKDSKAAQYEARIREQINLAYHDAFVGGQGEVTEALFISALNKEFGENNYELDSTNQGMWIVIVNKGQLDEVTENITRISSSNDSNNNNNNNNTDAPDLLKDYVLGIEVNGTRQGKDLESIFNMDSMSFIDDPNTVEDESADVVILNVYTAEVNDIIVYAKYNNAAYRILVDVNFDTEEYKTSDVVKVYEPDANSNVGKVVQYSVDGNATETDWLVLYDNGSTIDIMSIDVMGEYTLGRDDSNATTELDDSDPDYDLSKAMDSYENAVSRLNAYCRSLVNNPTAQKVRSVGTKFDIADTTARYSSEFLANNPLDSEGRYNEVVKTGDMNGEQDIVRMSYYSPGGIFDSGLRICKYNETILECFSICV